MNIESPEYVPRKLIEIFFPVQSIGEMAQHEKKQRFNHPSTIHPWWGRRPLGVVRALIFAQTVNDPCSTLSLYPEKSLEDAEIERGKLIDLTNQLANWNNSNNEKLLEDAFNLIKHSWGEICKLDKDKNGRTDQDMLPEVYDFFSGSGAVPLESVRLGLNAYASDLNPVAIMTSKATVDIPVEISKMNIPNNTVGQRQGANEDSAIENFVNDIRYYGRLVRESVKNQIATQYADIPITDELRSKHIELSNYKDDNLSVMAWMWCRTIRSPNPAYSDKHVPLVSNWQLSSKKGNEVWVEPVIQGDSYRFQINHGSGKLFEPTIKKGIGRCILSDTVIDKDYIKEEGAAGRIDLKLMALVCSVGSNRIFLPASVQNDLDINEIEPIWKPSNKLTGQNATQLPQYGIETFADLFNNRQLNLLNTYSKEIQDVWQVIFNNVKLSEIDGTDDTNAKFYADSVVLYLGLALDKISAMHCQLSRWSPSRTQIKSGLSRNYIPMTWEFPEVNPFSESAGDFSLAVTSVINGIQRLNTEASSQSFLADASVQRQSQGKVIVIDPPFFDNILYGDLSEFYYIWMRKTLKPFYGDLLSTIETPKEEEIVASRFLNKTKKLAMQKYRDRMKDVFKNLHSQSDERIPFSLFYTYKQIEMKDNAPNEYENFIGDIINTGFVITSCWPIHTELETRKSAQGKNISDSSIIITGRKREEDARTISVSKFFRKLRNYSSEMLKEIHKIESEKYYFSSFDWQIISTMPVLKLYSSYEGVLDSKGDSLSIHDVLSMANRKISDELFLNIGASDNDTLFCINWFVEYGFKEGKYANAEILSRAKGVDVKGICDAGVGESGNGLFRLIPYMDYPTNWDPSTDKRLPVWEAAHHIVRVLHTDGELPASNLLAELKKQQNGIYSLLHVLVEISNEKGWKELSGAYESLINSWDAISGS